MYLSPETKLLGLYDNKWPLPVIGVNLASSEYMDYPLKMSKSITYSRNGQVCDNDQVPAEYISCIEEMAVKSYKEAPQCANGMQLKCCFQSDLSQVISIFAYSLPVSPDEVPPGKQKSTTRVPDTHGF